MTAELRNSTAFDGYVTGFWVHSEVTFHIIVSVTNAEDVEICIAEIRSIICKECLFNLRISRQYIYIFIPVKFSSFLYVLCKGLYLVSARSLFSFLSRALLANSLACLAALVLSDSVTAE